MSEEDSPIQVHASIKCRPLEESISFDSVEQGTMNFDKVLTNHASLHQVVLSPFLVKGLVYQARALQDAYDQVCTYTGPCADNKGEGIRGGGGG